MKLVREVYVLIGQIPTEERFGLKSQMSRSAVSIPSNIAEGSGRTTDKEFARALDIAIGSAFELETQLLLSCDLFHIEAQTVIEECQKIQRMITGFKNRLIKNQ